MPRLSGRRRLSSGRAGMSHAYSRQALLNCCGESVIQCALAGSHCWRIDAAVLAMLHMASMSYMQAALGFPTAYHMCKPTKSSAALDLHFINKESRQRVMPSLKLACKQCI